MKKITAVLSLGLSIIAAAPAYAGLTFVDNPAAPAGYCREFTDKVKVGNRLVDGYGTACLQPDGSWQIVKPASVAPETVQARTIVEPVQAYYEPQPRTVVVIGGWPYYSHRWYNHHGWRGGWRY